MAKMIALTGFALVAVLAFEYIAIAPFVHFMVSALDHVNSVLTLAM